METILYFFWTGFTDATAIETGSPTEAWTLPHRHEIYALAKRGDVFALPPRHESFVLEER